jgi:uncharacterized protein
MMLGAPVSPLISVNVARSGGAVLAMVPAALYFGVCTVHFAERMRLPDVPKKMLSCPICGKPTEQSVRPFCSARCKDVDLHRWMSGVYAVPAVEEDDIEDDEPQRERE